LGVRARAHLCAGAKLAAAQAGHGWAHCRRGLQQIGAQETPGSGVAYVRRLQRQQRAEKDDRGHRGGLEAMRARLVGHQGHCEGPDPQRMSAVGLLIKAHPLLTSLECLNFRIFRKLAFSLAKQKLNWYQTFCGIVSLHKVPKNTRGQPRGGLAEQGRLGTWLDSTVNLGQSPDGEPPYFET
jgi:hypothetical protein